jgi:hypothetical protein
MPHVDRPYLDDPANVQVWRYMDIEKLLSILVDQALFLPRRALLAPTTGLKVNLLPMS